MKKGVYRFHWDCGRAGFLGGIFVSTDAEVEQLIRSGYEVYFGEVLGKHSEVYGMIESKDMELLTQDKVIIDFFEGLSYNPGYNPFDYIDEDEYQEYLDEIEED